MSVLLFLAAALPVPALEGQAQIPAGSVSLAPNQRRIEALPLTELCADLASA